jgi:hypothetical protein
MHPPCRWQIQEKGEGSWKGQLRTSPRVMGQITRLFPEEEKGGRSQREKQPRFFTSMYIRNIRAPNKSKDADLVCIAFVKVPQGY